MKNIPLRIMILTGMLALGNVPELLAAPGLSISISSAPPGATAFATVALTDVSDVESYGLELSLGSGSTLQLPASSWFSRGAYFPSTPFGAAPTVELNTSFESTGRTRIFIDGFKPTGTTGAIGTVQFTVNPSASVGSYQGISLSGSYYSKASASVKAFTSTSTNFVVGSVPSYNLKIIFAGTGSGMVTSTPSGLACNTTTTQSFSANTALVLHPAPLDYSLFKGWSGACTAASGDCSLTMTSDKTVTATFNRDSAHQVLLDGASQVYYPTILSAYQAAASGNTIRIWGTDFTETFSFNLPISVTLKGGYDQGYGSNTDYTTLRGTLTIGKGTLTVEQLIVW